MKQPDTYQLDDFLSDATFRAWVRQGGLRQADAPWSRWWHAHPAQQATMRQAQNILLAAHLPDEAVTSEQTAQFVRQTLARTQTPAPVRPLRRYVGYLAALGLLLIGFGWWFARPDTFPLPRVAADRTPPAARLRERHNQTGRPEQLTLADGSTVLLQPGARLRYPARFRGKNREVTLVGEAFFRITKNPEQPFLVLANGMVTKVLGTSFVIRANETDPTVTVEVKTGRVAVFAQADLTLARQSPGLSARSVLVTPNQQVVFVRQSGQMNRSLVDEPALLKIPDRNRDFTFTEAPLSQVFATLETAYGVDIIYDADAVQSCTLTAPLGNEPLFEKLSIICRAIGGRYEVVGAQIVVQSDGCE